MVRGTFLRINYYLEYIVEVVFISFLPLSRMLQFKDDIYNFRQLHYESMYRAWFRFKKMFIMVSNHIITGSNLLEIFNRTRNTTLKALVDIITGGSFIRLCQGQHQRYQIISLSPTEVAYSRDRQSRCHLCYLGFQQTQSC